MVATYTRAPDRRFMVSVVVRQTEFELHKLITVFPSYDSHTTPII